MKGLIPGGICYPVTPSLAVKLKIMIIAVRIRAMRSENQSDSNLTRKYGLPVPSRGSVAS
jgi:hypothetical protein